MSDDPKNYVNRNNPTRDDFDDLLELLAAANAEGQVVSIVFMLRSPNGKGRMVDYRGPMDQTDLAASTVRERIADAMQESRPDIAKAIRETNAPVVRTH